MEVEEKWDNIKKEDEKEERIDMINSSIYKDIQVFKKYIIIIIITIVILILIIVLF